MLTLRTRARDANAFRGDFVGKRLLLTMRTDAIVDVVEVRRLLALLRLACLLFDRCLLSHYITPFHSNHRTPSIWVSNQSRLVGSQRHEHSLKVTLANRGGS